MGSQLSSYAKYKVQVAMQFGNLGIHAVAMRMLHKTHDKKQWSTKQTKEVTVC